MTNKITKIKSKEDVEDFVKCKIKNIKCVDDIFANNTFKIDKEGIIEKEGSYNMLLPYKKISQLTLNAFNDFENYKNLEFKFIPECNDLSLPDFYHKCDGNKDMWLCSDRPTEDQVIEAFYKYVFCFLSIYNQENKVTINDEIITKDITQCIYCDLEIPPGADQCPGCQELVSDLRIELAKKEDSKNMLYDMKDVDPINERKADSLESVKKVDGASGHDNKFIDKHESDGDAISTKNTKEGKVDAKWKCGGCECLNEYTHGNCVACQSLYKDGKWSCGECTFESSCANDYCEVCAAINTNANVAVNVGTEGAVKNELFGDGRVCDKCGSRVDGREKLCGKCVADNTDRKDQWRCGKCGLMNAYSVDICNVCDASRIGMGKWTCDKCTVVNNCTDVKCTVCDAPNDYLAVKYCEKCNTNKVSFNKRYCDGCVVNRTNREQWTCGKCTVVNNCTDVKCTMCDTPIYNLTANYCEKCNTNKVPSNRRYCDGCERTDIKWGPNKWSCQYPKCKEYNDYNDQYCHVCRLQRDYCRARGENVKLWYDDKETIMWLCHKCNKINKPRELVCIDCRETRYKKRYCKDCQEYNDGTTKSCDKCNQQL